MTDFSEGIFIVGIEDISQVNEEDSLGFREFIDHLRDIVVSSCTEASSAEGDAVMRVFNRIEESV